MSGSSLLIRKMEWSKALEYSFLIIGINMNEVLAKSITKNALKVASVIHRYFSTVHAWNFYFIFKAGRSFACLVDPESNYCTVQVKTAVIQNYLKQRQTLGSSYGTLGCTILKKTSTSSEIYTWKDFNFIINNQCCESALVARRIRMQHLRSMRIQIKCWTWKHEKF